MSEGQKLKMVCDRCGGDNVMRDAWAEWDVEKQEWVLRGEPFDNACCDDCGCESFFQVVHGVILQINFWQAVLFLYPLIDAARK